MKVRNVIAPWFVLFMCYGCGSSPTSTTVNAFVMVSPNGDTLGHGPIQNDLPQGGWKFNLANGAMIKEGSYDQGLLTGPWQYKLDGTAMSVVWQPRQSTSVEGLSMSVPANFHLDGSSDSSMNFSWRDSSCYWMLEVHVDPKDSDGAYDRRMAQEMATVQVGQTKVSQECSLLDLSTSKAPIVDHRFYFEDEGDGRREVRYTMSTLNGRSVWLRLEHTCDTDVQNMLYGEVLQSLLYQGTYFFDPRGELRASKPC